MRHASRGVEENVSSSNPVAGIDEVFIGIMQTRSHVLLNVVFKELSTLDTERFALV